jgi:hypothetical protein
VSNFVEENLHPGETVVYRGQMSWAPALSRGLMTLAASIVVFLAAPTIASLVVSVSAQTKSANHPTALPYDTVGRVLTWVALAFLVGAIFSLGRGLIARQTAEYAVTDQRVIGKYGLISQQSVDVMITAIVGVSTTKTALGRIFDYGTVWVDGTGTRDCLVNIKNPKTFASAVYNGRLGNAPAAAPAAANSRVCARCQRELDPGARFCAGCGAPVG